MVHIISSLILFEVLIVNYVFGNAPTTGEQVFGIRTTYHGAHEAGACALPKASYAISHPIAIGDIESLKYFKYRPELCGHVLQLDCGNGPLDVIVVNSNLGQGLDLYASTWNRLTNHMSPGITQCSIQLSARKAFDFDGPRCFHRPGSDSSHNEYYRCIGLLNTGGQIVISATIDDHRGKYMQSSPYFEFTYGQKIDGNKQIVFNLADGTTHKVYLRDCENQYNQQLWR
ncbi:unnamed protein product [Adineta ricciae]|uniref:Uncharacterized protein n=1 Tax=Adineta ricciae TaxID=249248 RepID=A0A815MBH8_ADIRI|nr:unnamed protein product [Adineta ricciae]